MNEDSWKEHGALEQSASQLHQSDNRRFINTTD